MKGALRYSINIIYICVCVSVCVCAYIAILKMYHVSFLINIYQWLPIILMLKPQFLNVV